MIHKRKGQAAMEFLMTYGWAILAAVIVIAVLASFGVFSSKNFIPTTCTISAPFGCDKNQVAAYDSGVNENQILVILRNGDADANNITDVNITGCTEGAIVPALPFVMAAGEVTNVYVPCNDLEIQADEKFTGDWTLTYHKAAGGVVDFKSSGSITVKIAA